MKFTELIRVAANLTSEGGNPEYDRALTEFVIDLTPTLSMDDADVIDRIIRAESRS